MYIPRFTFCIREWAILGLFFLLTLVMLYPLSLKLTSMVPEPTDPLLNVWRMQWNAHAFLGGPAALANIFNANIFYPFPLTLAYSEHFLLLSAQMLPFLLLSDSHLLGMNLSVLFTFVLSGYTMYLLITAWTGQRWAGFIAGVLFAFSPHRFGQLNHLELLVTQWLPLALLALHWTLTRPGWRYPLLFAVVFNLQALSGFHFSFNLTLACALLALVYAVSGRVYWRWGLGVAAFLSILITLLLNWPIWRMYLIFSDVMGAVRTPGEVRIYSAAFTDYLTAIPHNLLYGWTFGRWQAADHQFQPLLPFGLVGLCLALAGLFYYLKPFRRTAKGKTSRPYLTSPSRDYTVPSVIFLLLLTLLGLLLSFGLNEEALGHGLAPLLRFSPYVWLYNQVTFFQGIRVPGRFGILVVLGLVGLAGGGTSTLSRFTLHASSLTQISLAIGLTALILLESWSAPLVGPEIPAGTAIPAVYPWLRAKTAPDEVILELPYQNVSEFMYEYYATYHWRRLANGGTGFTPPIYREMRQWFKTFPDARSVDVIQQLGINRVVLHSAAYSPEEWQRLLAVLPLYWPAFSQVNQVGGALILRVAPSLCQAQPDQITATLTPAPGRDGLSEAVQVMYHNAGPAAFVADVQHPSRLTFADQSTKNFTEPLVTPAGEVQSILSPLPGDRQAQRVAGAWLATLDRTIALAETSAAAKTSQSLGEEGPTPWQPLGLQFADGPQLAAYGLTPEAPTTCGRLKVGLKWSGGQPGDTAIVQLLDPFGRVVSEDRAQPWFKPAPETSEGRDLPLPGSLPPGRYGLRIYVRTAAGQERLPITAEGVTIPTDQIPPLPVIIHPAPLPTISTNQSDQPVWGRAIRLVGSQLAQTEAAPGDWLRFTLVWQADQPLENDLTVFTQLLGPDGQVWGQYDNQPKGGWYSTSLWPPGQIVSDDYAFQIKADAPAGEYRLIAGLYNSASLERLPVQTPAGAADFVEVGTVQVSLPESQQDNQ
ncbi:MAG: hypothetical protein HS126_01675 [Anaerolineales bacterium]|nr:hypothetical protein [Anaerolineales bacterium]